MAFEETEESPVPSPPYLVYLIPHQKKRGADVKNNIKETDFSLELYTDKFALDREDLEEMVEEKVFLMWKRKNTLHRLKAKIWCNPPGK